MKYNVAVHTKKSVQTVAGPFCEAHSKHAQKHELTKKPKGRSMFRVVTVPLKKDRRCQWDGCPE